MKTPAYLPGPAKGYRELFNMLNKATKEIFFTPSAHPLPCSQGMYSFTFADTVYFGLPGHPEKEM